VWEPQKQKTAFLSLMFLDGTFGIPNFFFLFRAEEIERSQVLRTKAMREKEEQREMRKYRYALIRIRFPDGILLQVIVYFS
jgi:hypothetical protein